MIHMSGIMISVLTSISEDRGFHSRSCLTSGIMISVLTSISEDRGFHSRSCLANVVDSIPGRV